MSPYKEYKSHGKYVLENTSTGSITRFSSAASREKIKHLREAIAHGWHKSKVPVKAHSRKGKQVRKHARRVKKKMVHKHTYRLPIVEGAQDDREWRTNRRNYEDDFVEKEPAWDLYDKEYPIVRRTD
jgi:hypothetical protein